VPLIPQEYFEFNVAVIFQFNKRATVNWWKVSRSSSAGIAQYFIENNV
jgi:hypothetical protein